MSLKTGKNPKGKQLIRVEWVSDSVVEISLSSETMLDRWLDDAQVNPHTLRLRLAEWINRLSPRRVSEEELTDLSLRTQGLWWIFNVKTNR